MPDTQLPHILLEGPSNSQEYTSPLLGGGEQFRKPIRDRVTHARYISRRLEQAWAEPEANIVAGHVERNGIYLVNTPSLQNPS